MVVLMGQIDDPGFNGTVLYQTRQCATPFWNIPFTDSNIAFTLLRIVWKCAIL